MGPDNEMTADPNWTYSYDAVGNLIGKTAKDGSVSWVYAYNNVNQLVSAQEMDENGNVIASETDVYDALGDRIEVDVTQNGTTTVQKFAFDGQNVYADLSGGGGVQTWWVWGDQADQLLGRVDAAGQASMTVTDHLGSVKVWVDQTGTVVDKIDYDAYGNKVRETDASKGSKYGFTAYRQDQVTQWYAAGNGDSGRWYIADAGRFNRQDSMGFSGGQVNLYGYVQNNPTNETDPSGNLIFFSDASGGNSPTLAKFFNAILQKAGEANLKIKLDFQIVYLSADRKDGAVIFSPEAQQVFATIGKGVPDREGYQGVVRDLIVNYAGSDQNHAALSLNGNEELAPVGYTPSDYQLTELNRAAKASGYPATYRNNGRAKFLDVATGTVKGGTELPLIVLDTASNAFGADWNNQSMLWQGGAAAAQQEKLGEYAGNVGITIVTFGGYAVYLGYQHGEQTGDYSGAWQAVGAIPTAALSGRVVRATIAETRTPIGNGTTSPGDYIPNPVMENLARGYGAAAEAAFAPKEPFAPTVLARPANSPNYSEGFQAQLRKGIDFPGVKDTKHFQAANRLLDEAFQRDPKFAADMEKIFPGIIEGVKPGPRGAYPSRPPTADLTWHHHPSKVGILELIPREQHRAPGPVQQSLHPNQRGGMENWGGGRD